MTAGTVTVTARRESVVPVGTLDREDTQAHKDRKVWPEPLGHREERKARLVHKEQQA